MDALSCPHCGQGAFTKEAAMSLGPARTINCPACRGRVGVPWSGALLFLGVFLGPLLLLAALVFLVFGERMAHTSLPPAVVLVLTLIPAALTFPLANRPYRARLRLVKR